MRREYEKDQNLEAMVREERTGTAEQQLRLFERSLVVGFPFYSSPFSYDFPSLNLQAFFLILTLPLFVHASFLTPFSLPSVFG